MADDNKLIVKIELDSSTVKTGFDKIEAEGSSTFRRIGEVAAGVFAGNLLTQGLANLKAELSGLFTEAVNSSASFDLSVQKLNSALALSGKLTGGASQSYQDLASKIQRTTAYSDDTVVSVATLAATYAKTNAQALKLTQATVDFAAATGRDANEAALQLSQTLNGQTGRLARLFPELKQFSAAQLEAGAAVDFFAKRFAGAAVSQVDTFAGRVSQLKNNFDDLLKSLGQYITRSPAITAAIAFITDTLGNFTENISRSLGKSDPFAGVITELALVAQAVIETGRQIGLSFELGYERAKRAYLAFKVISTLGLSDSFNQDLLDANNRIKQLKDTVAGDSAATKFFDDLITRIRATSGELKAFTGEDLSNGLVAAGAKAKTAISGFMGPVQQEIYSTGEAFQFFGEGFIEGAEKIKDSAVKNFKEAGAQAVSALGNAFTSGFAAIGKALVKGQDVFKAFAGALLAGIGAAAIQMGSFFVLLGLAKTILGDPSGPALIAVGGALAVLGGALTALGDGVTGTSNPSTSISTGGGSAIETGGSSASSTAATVAETRSPGIVVNIQGDVLDSNESGIRIIGLINDAFNSSGARVLAT